MSEQQAKFTEPQLLIIDRINRLPVDPNCAHGCTQSCRLATEAATNVLTRTDLTLPAGYEQCVNATKVLYGLVALQNSEPKIITTE